MRFQKVLLLSILPLMTVFLSSSVSAWPWSNKNNDNRPLYVSPKGWQIYGAVTAEKIVSIYRRAQSMARNIGANANIEYWDYIINNGEDDFYAFVLIIPDNQTIFWQKNSKIILTYVNKGDTFTVDSEEFFFANKCSSCKPAMIKNNEIRGFYSVPNKIMYRTPHGYPVVFAKFKFPKKKYPEYLVSCSVDSVISVIKKKEVSGR